MSDNYVLPEIKADIVQNINIRIAPAKNSFVMEVQADDDFIRCDLEITSNDLAKWNQRLQGILRDISRMMLRSKDDSSINNLDNYLIELAEVGYFIFNKIFNDKDIVDILNAKVHTNDKVQIVSENFFFPWECLYSSPIDNIPRFDLFWGFKYIIQRLIVQRNKIRPKSNLMQYNHRPKIGLFSLNSLKHVKEREIPYFEKLNASGAIELFHIRNLNPSHKRDEIAVFKDAIEQDINVVHFACHAEYDADFLERSAICISENFYISIQDIENNNFLLRNHPLIILNACDTGIKNPLYSSHFAKEFLNRGARGVITTECRIPDNFASEFTEKIYTYLLREEDLGLSLLTTRRDFWQESQNPLGLVYSMYAPPSLRLQQRKICELPPPISDSTFYPVENNVSKDVYFLDKTEPANY